MRSCGGAMLLPSLLRSRPALPRRAHRSSSSSRLARRAARRRRGSLPSPCRVNAATAILPLDVVGMELVRGSSAHRRRVDSENSIAEPLRRQRRHQEDRAWLSAQCPARRSEAARLHRPSRGAAGENRGVESRRWRSCATAGKAMAVALLKRRPRDLERRSPWRLPPSRRSPPSSSPPPPPPASSARPPATPRRSAFASLRGGAGETQLASVDALPFREALPWLRHVRTPRHPAVPRDPRRAEGRVDGRALLGRRDRVPARVARRGGEEVPRVPARAGCSPRSRRRRGKLGRRDGFGEAAAWHPEYGAWMLEGTPRVPYGGCALGLGHTRVERGARGPARATQPALLAPPATAGTPPTSAASRRTCGCVASGSSRSSAATSAP